jgi:hypothetical protein
MHRRIIRVLSVATAAGALSTFGLMAAGASTTAMAPSGTVSEYNCTTTATDPCQAGYEADSRNFRYVQALITTPNRPSLQADPAMEVKLEHAVNEYAAIGIRPCQTDGTPTGCDSPDIATPADAGWELFTHVNNSGTQLDNQVMVVPNGTAVLVSAYWNPNGTSVNFQASIDGVTMLNVTTPVLGTPYTEAEAGADWRYTQPTSPVPDFVRLATNRPATVVADTRLTQFLDGRITTQSGQRGTFKGPWTLVNVIATSNGMQPGIPGGGTLEADPSFLWTDSLAQGMFGDAFGLWIRA